MFYLGVIKEDKIKGFWSFDTKEKALRNYENIKRDNPYLHLHMYTSADRVVNDYNLPLYHVYTWHYIGEPKFTICDSGKDLNKLLWGALKAYVFACNT